MTEQTTRPAPAKPQAAARPSNQGQPTDINKWLKIIGLVLVGFFLSRVLSTTPPATSQPIVAAAVQPAIVAPQPAPLPAPVAHQPQVIVQQPQPIYIQQPQVTILKPQETIVIQKSYPNRTIILESNPTVLVQ